jgi:hypothetical protein
MGFDGLLILQDSPLLIHQLKIKAGAGMAKGLKDPLWTFLPLDFIYKLMVDYSPYLVYTSGN